MDSHYCAKLFVLVPIAAIGLIATPIWESKFIYSAIILELSFVAQSALAWKGYSKALCVYSVSRLSCRQKQLDSISEALLK